MSVPLPSRQRSRGVAAVEFALVLPILIVMLLCVVDLARALQAQMIVINISREGANLASRGSVQLSDASLSIMESLVASAPPLDMNGRGMIYITRVAGYKDSGVVRNIVLEQYRWQNDTGKRGYSNSKYAPGSKIYTCGGTWGSTGACSSNAVASSSSPTAAVMTGALADGDVIYVVETYYNFNMVFTGAKFGSLTTPTIGPNLYSLVVF